MMYSHLNDLDVADDDDYYYLICKMNYLMLEVEILAMAVATRLSHHHHHLVYLHHIQCHYYLIHYHRLLVFLLDRLDHFVNHQFHYLI